MEMRLPNWARLVLGCSAFMQLIFAATLVMDPGRIVDLWPWPLPPLSARLLGASTLVSVPMAFLAIGINRFGVAMIPLVMMLTYRVLQLAAGLIHIDRFELASVTAVNYFGGGLLMMFACGYPLWAGLRDRLPPAAAGAPLGTPVPWRAGASMRALFIPLAAAYALLGLTFLVLGGAAGGLWIDAGGMTPLTARLFASPLIGLGLGMFLVTRVTDWRAAFVPAVGMVTIGLAGTFSLWMDLATLVPQTPLAWLVVATPPVLLVVGTSILLSRLSAGASERLPDPHPARLRSRR